jgi:5'(3')-deoxyribonucleotidase
MKVNKKYQIFCDMDGVLVDFEGAVVEQINKDLKDASVTGKKIKRLRDDLYRLDRDFITKEDLDKINKEKRLRSARKYMYYRCSNDEDLWANLPWAKDGKELWEEISKYNPFILTAPLDDAECKNGKFRWIKNNLVPHPEKIFMSHEKYLWSTTSGQPNILIDDFNINTIPWDNYGGISILHVNTKNTLEELKKICG